MEEKDFPGKMEDIPVVAGMLFDSYRKDQALFTGFSPMFTPAYIAAAEAKRTECNDLVKAYSFTQERRAVTEKMETLADELRIQLNSVEGYLKISAKNLDIAVSGFGLNLVRDALTDGNMEGATASAFEMLRSVRRNQLVLAAKGLTPELLENVTAMVDEMNSLNIAQNTKLSDRMRATDENIGVFNELWEIASTIMVAAKAMFRGVDDVKLKDYTMTQLIKRVNAEGTNPAKPEA